MSNLQSRQRNTEKILTYGVLIAFSLLLLRLIIFNFGLIFYPFPLEYREAAPLTNTILLLKGGNPYAIANQPETTNVYGILYPLFVYPFAKLFGASIPVHRAISTFFILASSGLIFWVMRWQKVSLTVSFVAASVFYWHQILALAFVVKPDSMGCFLFLASLVIAWRYNYSWLGLVLSIILGLLGFISKPYFVLSIPYLCIYIFLFKSQKKSILYGLLSLLATIFTCGILNHLFPSYFDNTFFGYLNQKLAGSGFDYAVYQINTYIFENLSIVTIFIFFADIFTKENLLNFPRVRVRRKFPEKINSSKINRPLIKANVDLFTFCFAASLFLFVLKLGQHSGTWLVYLYHLVSPFMIILAFRLADKLEKKAVIALMFLVSLNLFFVYPESRLKGKETYQQWENLKSLVAPHKNVLNSPAIASILMEQNKKVYDSGQSEYFVLGAKRKIFNIELPRDNKIEQRVRQYQQEIADSVKARKFNLVVLTKNYLEFISESLLKKCYNYQGKVTVNMLAQTWELDVWRPKKSTCK